MHLKSIAMAVALAVAPLCGATARTAADFFVQAPESVMPLLPKNTRLDMLDYFRGGLSTPSANSLDGRSRITAETPEALTVQVARDASMQFVVLPQGRDTVVAVVHTVLTPLADSGIRLYRASDWTPLKTQPAMPGAAEFGAPSDSAAEMPPFLFVRAEYKPDRKAFVFTNTTPGYYVASDMPAGLSAMRSTIEMVLKGRKFVEVKQ